MWIEQVSASDSACFEPCVCEGDAFSQDGFDLRPSAVFSDQRSVYLAFRSGLNRVATSRDAPLPHEDAITRLVGAILREQNDEWAAQRSRDLMLKRSQVYDDPLVRPTAMAA